MSDVYREPETLEDAKTIIAHLERKLELLQDAVQVAAPVIEQRIAERLRAA